MLSCLIAMGDGLGYRLPEELPGDETFAYHTAEVRYMGGMG